MYLKKLHLKNIKCFKDFTIDFVDKKERPRMWTSILGNNGVGKTIVLQSIALALTGGNSIHDVLPYPVHWVRSEEKWGSIEATVSFEKNELPAKNSPKELTLFYYVIGPEGATIKGEFFPGPGIVEPGPTKNSSHFQRNLRDSSPFLAGYGTFRVYTKTHTKSNIPERENPRSRRIASLFRDSSVMMDIEGWLRELEYDALKFETPSDTKLYEKAMAATESVLPTIKISKIGRDKQLYVKTSSGEIPLSELSDAYMSLFSWTGDLFMRLFENYHDLKDPKKGSGVVLVDEIGLHMHPTSQRKIIDWLRTNYPNIQFIVTSHSPFIAQASREGEIFVFEDIEGQTNLRPFEGSLKGWRVDQILTTIFDMETTRDLDTENKIKQYDELLMQKYKKSFSEQQRETLEKLKNELSVGLSPPGESLGIMEKQKELSQIIEALKKPSVITKRNQNPVERKTRPTRRKATSKRKASTRKRVTRRND